MRSGGKTPVRSLATPLFNVTEIQIVSTLTHTHTHKLSHYLITKEELTVQRHIRLRLGILTTNDVCPTYIFLEMYNVLLCDLLHRLFCVLYTLLDHVHHKFSMLYKDTAIPFLEGILIQYNLCN